LKICLFCKVFFYPLSIIRDHRPFTVWLWCIKQYRWGYVVYWEEVFV
jgi:hypothetical protein